MSHLYSIIGKLQHLLMATSVTRHLYLKDMVDLSCMCVRVSVYVHGRGGSFGRHFIILDAPSLLFIRSEHLLCFLKIKKDSFNESVSSILERKVRSWLSGVIDDMRRSSPVQQWLDSLPADNSKEADKPEAPEGDTQTDETHKETDSQDTVVVSPNNKVCEENNLEVPCSSAAWKRKSLESGLLPSTPHSGSVRKRLQRDHSIQSEGCSPKLKNPLFRDYSLQSDASGSSGSSVLNVLGARKVDAESVLLAMGFGPSEKQQRLQRIPDRFLAPSKLKGISTEQFIKNEQHSMRMHDCGVFGYRGLTGNPHVPPSTIVAKIMECILHGDVCREHALARTRHSIADPSAHVNFTSRLPKN